MNSDPDAGATGSTRTSQPSASPVPCPRCGVAIPPGTKLDLCPNCLLRAATLEESSPTEEPGAGLSRPQTGIGDYDLLEVIGQGGMGVVYRARQKSVSRLVALKMVLPALPSPTFLRRFQIEVQAAASLLHPNILPVFEVGEHEGHAFFTMPLVVGQTLRQRLARKELFPGRPEHSLSKSQVQSSQKSTAALMAKVARAVHYAHEQGIFHRDLKPGNILIDEAGEPHLLDFGLAKITHLDGDPGDLSLTLPETVLGTPGYMSPEQATGFRKVRLVDEHALAWSDIYSLGAVLYELLTGQAPFSGVSPQEILSKVQTDTPKRPRAINPWINRDLETVAVKCLEKNPQHRYNTAADLAQDLERWLGAKPILARPIGPVRRTGRWIKRNPLGAALIFNLFIGLAVTLGFLKEITRQKDRQELIKDILLNSVTADISEMTEYPDLEFVTIPRIHLALLAGREPVLDEAEAKAELTFGIARNRDASGLAQDWAYLLRELEQQTSLRSAQKLLFNFRLFRMGKPGESILIDEPRGHCDFALIGPVDYLLARQGQLGVRLLASLPQPQPYVVFVQENSPVRHLAELKGRRVALNDPRSAAATFARACLAKAGLTAADLRFGLLSPGDAESALVSGVRRGEYDAGICGLRLFERTKAREPRLRSLTEIPSSPKLFVARAGLSEEILALLRKAILGLPEYPALGKLKPVTDEDLTELRQALERAHAAFPDEPANPILIQPSGSSRLRAVAR